MPTALGLAMMVPSVVSIGAVVALLGALQLQVRVVEEPYLLRVHGNAYRNYAREVGRFLPGLGRIED
jgi:protein-S-isoprenylcysteine O-methyltransferase Ste14